MHQYSGMKTTNMNSKLPLFACAAVLSLTAACATGPKASASATAEPDEAEASAVAEVSEPEPESSKLALDTIDHDLEPIPAPENEEPEPEYTSVVVFVDPTLLAACGIKPPKVFFETDSAKVHEVGDNKLDYLAECLNRKPLNDDLIEIVGHADPRGAEDYNRELGLDRANAVAARLSAYGVASKRIDTYSMGESKATDDPEQWRTDRRVVVRLDK